MVNLTLMLLSLPLLLQATPLVSRVAKNPLICDAGCTGSTCKRDVSPFGQDSSPFTLAKRHINSAADLDEQPSHYIANRINGKSEKGAREGLKWDYTTVDATSIDGKFKVTKDKDPKTKVGDDVDNTRAWVEGLEGCTGIAVVSEKGYWLAHLMEPGFYEPDGKRWEEKIIKPLTAGGAHFTTPKSHSAILNEANNVKIYISTPSKGYSPETDTFNAPAYDDKVAELVKLLTSGTSAPFPGVKPTIRKYDRPQNAAEIEKFRKMSNGKMLIEYTSHQYENGIDEPAAGQTAMFRVWLEKQMYPEHEWVVVPATCELDTKSPTKKTSLKERFFSFVDRRAAKPKAKASSTKKACARPTSTTKSARPTTTNKVARPTTTKKATLPMTTKTASKPKSTKHVKATTTKKATKPKSTKKAKATKTKKVTKPKTTKKAKKCKKGKKC